MNRKLQLLTIAMLLLMSLCVAAETDKEKDNGDWQPVAVWPFTYLDFTDATIITSSSQTVKAKANIHVGRHYVWYESHGQKLEVKHGVVSKVVFSNGDVYYPIEEKICRVIREDTINGKVGRLYVSEEVDKARFDELARMNSMGTLDIMGMPAGFSSITNSVADREGANRLEQEPLPMREKYYMLYNDETFEATEYNILSRLSKQERATYRTFVRSAEILAGDRRSMENIWITFFVK